MKKETLFTDILKTATKYFSGLVLMVLIGILCSGIRIVKSGSQAVILRFGKLVGKTHEQQVHGPGLLLAFPYIIDEVITVPTDKVFEQSVVTHYSGGGNGQTSETGYVMTGDNNIAVVSASVKYTVSDPVSYALNVKDISAVIDACVSSAMVSEAAHLRVDSLLTDGKDRYTKAVFQNSAEKLEKLGAGVRLTGIELTKVGMPEEVRGIYEQVNSAAVQVSTMIKEANQYREKLLPEARAAADTTVSEANASYAKKVADANSDLSEFWGVLDEYRSSPEKVRTRIYAQKASEIMGKIGTVRVVSDGETNILINPAGGRHGKYQ